MDVPWNLVALALWLFLLATRHRGRQRQITRSGALGFALPIPLQFELRRETWEDRLWKATGFTREHQTGDLAFDQSVYVESDHLGLHQLLRRDFTARAAARALLESGAEAVWGDGESIWVRRKKGGPQVGDGERLQDLARALQPLRGAAGHRTQDVGVTRVWLIEALSLLLVAYAIVHVFHWGRSPVPREVDALALLRPAVQLGGVGLITFAALGVLLLHGTSRGHRTLVHSLGIVALASPMAAFQGASDLNWLLDLEPAEELRCEVRSREVERQSKGVVRYRLELRGCEGAGAGRITRWIYVEEELFETLKVGDTLVGLVRPGALGIPWFQSRWGI